MLTLLLTATWLVTGLLAWGWTFSFVQNYFSLIAKENYKLDLLFSILLFATGPFGLMGCVLGTYLYEGVFVGRYGWRLW